MNQYKVYFLDGSNYVLSAFSYYLSGTSAFFNQGGKAELAVFKVDRVEKVTK